MTAKLIRCAGAPHHSASYRISEGFVSGPSHCGGLGFTQCTHSTIPVSSLSLKIPKSRAIRHLQLLFFRWAFDKWILQSIIQVNFWHLFLTVWVSIWNLESPVRGSISINSAWSSYRFLPLSSYILKIHSHTHSSDFCLHELASSLSSLAVQQPPPGPHFLPPPLGTGLTLSLLIGLEAIVGGPWGTTVLSGLTFPAEKKITIGLVGMEG